MFARARTEECVGGRSSARHRFHGVVTEVVGDAVTARVEITAGPFRVVPPTSRQAADGLGREVGVVATGVVKATDVVVEVPDHEQVTDQV